MVPVTTGITTWTPFILLSPPCTTDQGKEMEMVQSFVFCTGYRFGFGMWAAFTPNSRFQ
jgi:hypothetical protein